jgi:outer membrane lipoprotein-sorting protein
VRYVLAALLVLLLVPRAWTQTNEAEQLPHPAQYGRLKRLLDRAKGIEAERIFRAMEKKITEAKAFKVAVTIDAKGDMTQKVGSFRGFLLVTGDNKARLNVGGADFGEDRSWQMVSNGKQVKVRPYDVGVSEVSKDEETLPMPVNLRRHIARRVTRTGVYLNLLRMPVAMVLAAGSPDETLHVGGFKAGAAEKVGGRDAKVVHYAVGVSGPADDEATFTVWIDAKTLLPLKRVIVMKRWSVTITETYTEFTLDPKIDAGAFELTFPAGEAEKLFRAMEQKIKTANAVSVAVKVEGKAGDRTAKGEGSLLFTKENQARLKLTVHEPAKKETVEMVSDGRRMKFARSPETLAKAEAERQRPKLHDVLSRMVSGPGLWLTNDLVNGTYPVDFHLVAFEAGPAEKVGGRDAKVVRYMVAGLPGADYKVTLWIDAQTLLPLERAIGPLVGEDFRATETCEFTLNPKVGAGVFRLPK